MLIRHITGYLISKRIVYMLINQHRWRVFFPFRCVSSVSLHSVQFILTTTNVITKSTCPVFQATSKLFIKTKHVITRRIRIAILVKLTFSSSRINAAKHKLTAYQSVSIHVISKYYINTYEYRHRTRDHNRSVLNICEYKVAGLFYSHVRYNALPHYS